MTRAVEAFSSSVSEGVNLTDIKQLLYPRHFFFFFFNPPRVEGRTSGRETGYQMSADNGMLKDGAAVFCEASKCQSYVRM